MITITLPPLYPHQLDVIQALDDAKGKKVVVVSRRQVGKSLTACVALIKFSLENKGTSVILSPTLSQSRKMFRDICKMMEGSGIIIGANKTTLEIEWINGSIIYCKSGEQGDALRGLTVSNLMVIDEAAFLSDSVLETVQPITDVHNAPTLMISTPLFRSGKFYEEYINENNISFNWSEGYDLTKFLSPEKLEEYRKMYSELKFKSEYLGQFLDDGGMVFTDFAKCIRKIDKNSAPIYAGIDFSAFNNDKNDVTVLTCLNEAKEVCTIFTYKFKPVEQIEYLSSFINNNTTLKKVYCERNGVGDVYFDMLKRKVHRKEILVPWTTTNDSKRKIIDQLCTAFSQQEIAIPNDAELVKQLSHFAVTKTPTGKITYGGVLAHDDYVMSLAICLEASKSNNKTYNLSFRR